jgi:hypothetical protein
MIESIITGVVAIVVCIINNAIVHRANKQQHDTTIALIEYKLDQLTHKVDLHNNAVERLYKAEKQIELHEEKIKVANHRIDDLEE